MYNDLFYTSKLLKLKYILYLTLTFPQKLPLYATSIKTQRFYLFSKLRPSLFVLVNHPMTIQL